MSRLLGALEDHFLLSPLSDEVIGDLTLMLK